MLFWLSDRRALRRLDLTIVQTVGGEVVNRTIFRIDFQ